LQRNTVHCSAMNRGRTGTQSTRSLALFSSSRPRRSCMIGVSVVDVDVDVDADTTAFYFLRNNDHLSSECLFRFLVLAYSFINASMSDETFLANTTRTKPNPNPTQPNHKLFDCRQFAWNSKPHDWFDRNRTHSTPTQQYTYHHRPLATCAYYLIHRIRCCVLLFSALFCSMVIVSHGVSSCHVMSCRVVSYQNTPS